MKIIHFKDFDISRLKRYISLHGYNNFNNGYVFIDDNDKILGYCILHILTNKNIKLDWIYAKKGFGTNFLKRIERILSKKYNKILLYVSIDQNERKQTVKRRINFYIKNNYRVLNINYKKNGVEFKMFKKL